MGWTAANTWAANLSYAGYNDWRLPTMTDTGAPGCVAFANSGTDCGYNVDTAFSEMAHMYHNNLGLKSGEDASGNFQADFGVFGNGTYNGTDTSSYGENDVGLVQNLQAYTYWSGVPYAPDPTLGAWLFLSSDGVQFISNQNDELYAWAVRAGDVTANNTVPAPAPLWLIGSGLMALIGWRRKR